jgi:hypothetical protein
MENRLTRPVLKIDVDFQHDLPVRNFTAYMPSGIEADDFGPAQAPGRLSGVYPMALFAASCLLAVEGATLKDSANRTDSNCHAIMKNALDSTACLRAARHGQAVLRGIQQFAQVGC